MTSNFGAQIEDGEIIEDATEAVKIVRHKDSSVGESVGGVTGNRGESKPSNWSRRDGSSRPAKIVKLKSVLCCLICLYFLM